MNIKDITHIIGVALDTEFSSLVEGSHLYTPKVKLEDVILNENTKILILDTISGLNEFRKKVKSLGINNTPYESQYQGNGTVILFHGMSGTGKTMMANAIGNNMNRKILLLNYSALPSDKTEELLHLTFREAKIQNAIIFFDECEGLFQSRDLRGNHKVLIALNMIEQYDDIIILATNRPFDLDEAMYRRIQLSVEFTPPDVHLREQIWKSHIPKGVKLDNNINFTKLSIEFELTGGFIRNAVMTALKTSILRNKKLKKDDDIILIEEDIYNACKQQILGQLQLTGFNRRVIPNVGLKDIVLDKDTNAVINKIISKYKSDKVLTGQWDFKPESMCILINGKSGVGKSTLSEVISFECGKPMKILTCSELLNIHRSSFRSGINNKNNSDTIFSDLNSGAIVVIENCSLLFAPLNSTDIIGYLLFQIRRVKTIFIFILESEINDGVVVSMDDLQKTLYSTFNFIINVKPPNTQLRQKLWKYLIPKSVPITKDIKDKIDYKILADKYTNFVHSDIKRCITNACGNVCLNNDINKRCIGMKELIKAADNHEKHLHNHGLRLGYHIMYH